MEVFINGTVQELRELFSHNSSKELPKEHQGGSKNSDPPIFNQENNRKRGRPSSIDRTLNYIKDNPSKEYNLAVMSELIGVAPETLRNHMLELGYKYNFDKKRWIK